MNAILLTTLKKYTLGNYACDICWRTAIAVEKGKFADGKAKRSVGCVEDLTIMALPARSMVAATELDAEE